MSSNSCDVQTVCSMKTLSRIRSSLRHRHLFQNPHSRSSCPMTTRLSTLSGLLSMACWKDAWSSSKAAVTWTNPMPRTCLFCTGPPSTTDWKLFGMVLWFCWWITSFVFLDMRYCCCCCCCGDGSSSSSISTSNRSSRPGRCPEILKFVLKLELGPEICTYILKFSRVLLFFLKTHIILLMSK